MNKQIATNILAESINRLSKIRENLTITDIEAEVINNACLLYLKEKKNGNSIPIYSLSSAFTNAAKDLFPGDYVNAEVTAAQLHIPNNVKWDGMWDFLRKYFLENHHIKIDDIETETKDFNSIKHERYEFEQKVSEENIERLVSIDYLDDDDIMVRISPTLSPKKAFLFSSNNNTHTYNSYDGTYEFIIELDFMEEIEKFILKIPSRQLRIEYS